MRRCLWRLAFPALGLLGLAAAPSSLSAADNNLIYKKGSTLAQRQSDFDDCRVKSYAQVPQKTVRAPSSQYCYTVGTAIYCNPTGGGERDLNHDLRVRMLAKCLIDKGYKTVELPDCTSDQDIALARKQLSPQPAAAELKCTIGNELKE